MKRPALLAIVTFAFVLQPALFAQSPASNKAFFSRDLQGVTLAGIGSAGTSAPVTLYSLPATVKTSNGGALSATLSMEAALWTYNLTTAIVNGGKASSSSRAAIKAWVEVDGVPMEPGQVVYADRLQATGLTVNLACTVPGVTGCTVSGDVTLELFQKTKNANAFTFFLGPLPATVHSVEVKAQAFIECRANGVVIACPSSTLDGYTDASTQAAIGKSTVVIEEQQNWGKQ